MAADVTLLALPASAANWRAAETAVYNTLLPGDEVCIASGDRHEVVSCAADGTLTGPAGPLSWPAGPAWHVTAVCSGDARERFWRELFETAECLELGPAVDSDCWPHPTMAAGEYWRMPHIVSRSAITETMVRMNVADRSSYRDWDKPRPRDVKRWLTERLGWIVWTEYM